MPFIGIGIVYSHASVRPRIALSAYPIAPCSAGSVGVPPPGMCVPIELEKLWLSGSARIATAGFWNVLTLHCVPCGKYWSDAFRPFEFGSAKNPVRPLTHDVHFES